MKILQLRLQLRWDSKVSKRKTHCHFDDAFFAFKVKSRLKSFVWQNMQFNDKL